MPITNDGTPVGSWRYGWLNRETFLCTLLSSGYVVTAENLFAACIQIPLGRSATNRTMTHGVPPKHMGKVD